ncbi:MAG: MATE family efflux transporter, partial [Sedimentisphaerales bacterium]|nr:MATE family efflux transporter [Sedimentisphaerales bacterium]
MNTDKPQRMDARLTQGPVGRQLVGLVIPMVWGMFAIIAFNLTDTFFVGQLGTKPLAAISFTFPVVMTVGSIAVGLGVGAASVISRAIGQGDQGRVRRLTTDSLILTTLFVGLFCLLGLLTIRPLFRLLGANDDLLPLITEYMQIWYFGMIFLVVPMVGNNALRASGDTLNPSLVMIVSAVINVILDPILIFGLLGFPRMGLRGAALATVIARAFSLLAALAILHFRKRMLSWSLPPPKEMLRSWRNVLHVGIPAALMFVIVPVGGGIITRLLATFGKEEVAAFGVATRIESFAFILVYALSTSVTPFVGQNTGAGLFDRIRKGLSRSFIFCLIWGAVAAVVLGIFGKELASVFDRERNPQVIEVASMYLLIVPISYGLQGLTLIASAAFNALGRPLPATILTFFRAIIIAIPLGWILMYIVGPIGIFIGLAVSNICVGIWAYLWNR